VAVAIYLIHLIRGMYLLPSWESRNFRTFRFQTKLTTAIAVNFLTSAVKKKEPEPALVAIEPAIPGSVLANQ